MTDCAKPEYFVDITKEGIIATKENKINAYTSRYVSNKDRSKIIDTIDGSVEANIVINSEDKEFVNKDNKLLDEEREAKREMYFRQARVLYPEKEEWILNMAIDAFMEQQDKGIDITTHKFEKDAEKY